MTNAHSERDGASDAVADKAPQSWKYPGEAEKASKKPEASYFVICVGLPALLLALAICMASLSSNWLAVTVLWFSLPAFVFYAFVMVRSYFVRSASPKWYVVVGSILLGLFWSTVAAVIYWAVICFLYCRWSN